MNLYSRKVADLILENKLPITINGVKVKIEKHMLTKTVPVYVSGKKIQFDMFVS